MTSEKSDANRDYVRNNRSDCIYEEVSNAVARVLSAEVVPSFYNVAKEAQVARSTLYRRKELRLLVQNARANARPASRSYSSRLAVLQTEILKLQKENDELKLQLKQSPQRINDLNNYPIYSYSSVSF